MSLVETAHAGEIDRTVEALQAGGGVVLLHGAEPRAAVDLSWLALARLPAEYAIGVVDITRCQDDLDLARALVFAVASTYIGAIRVDAFLDGQWRFQRDADLLALVEMTSPRFYAALTERPDSFSDPRELFELSVDAFARRGAEGPTVLVLRGADELVPTTTRRFRFAAARDLLWTLRGRLQQSIGQDYVLFAGSERTAELIAAKDAAFLGWGTEVPIERLPFDRLRRHLEAALRAKADRLELWEPFAAHALALNFASECSGSPFLAEQLLELAALIALERPKGHRVQEYPLAGPTVDLLLDLNAGRLSTQTRLVKGLAPQALRIATALANDDRPYSVVNHPSDASRALRVMFDNAIVAQESDSRWTLCDPMFALWLKRPHAGRLRIDRRGTEPIPRWAMTT
ncbi:MAG: hypothetical protein ACYDHH_31020, partial [Solirubrobacteraceae bacterium]